MKRSSLPAVLALALALGAPVFAQAQGTRADYARAATVEAFARSKVVGGKITPHWFRQNSCFWYVDERLGGQDELFVVDADGQRRKVVDRAKLAEALAKATGRQVVPERSQPRRFRLAANGSAVIFDSEGKRWQYDPGADQASELTGEDAASSDDESLPATLQVRPTRRTGEGTSLTFVNRLPRTVKVQWIDLEGRPVLYHTLAPGETTVQGTYGGHRWMVSDEADRPLAVYEAGEDAGVALIDPARLPKPEPPKRRPAHAGVQSPDGRRWARVRDNNVFLFDETTGEETALTHDGRAGDAYEGDLYWSPDSRRLVATRTVPAQDHKIHFVESSPGDQIQPKWLSEDYLKPGDRIAHPKPHLFRVPEGTEIPLDDALFPNPWALDEFHWSPDSGSFTFTYNQRGHQIMRVLSVDAETGGVRPVVDEQSATFIDYSGKHFLKYVDGGAELVWMSERDGWNHLYLYEVRTGVVKNQITRGPWVVRGIDRVDEQARQIWFRAGGIRPGQSPYYTQYCRVNFDGTGLTILTSADGEHTVEFSPDGRWLLDTWSRVDQPPVSELRRTADGSLVCELARGDWSELLKAGWSVPEPFSAKGRDGTTDIYGVIFRPMNFDRTRKYPVIENIYAGPQDSFVPRRFQPAYGSQKLAELGFVVVQIDGMGTSNRSKAFHDVCWKNLQDAGLPDRILWMKAAAAKDPALDLSRVGIYGGSAGGQSALGALLFHGDFYKAAVADCGCHDNRMDKIWWNEQWMGWPVGPEYAEASNVTHAHQLQGKLLLIVGELDHNVDPASTMQVVHALIAADKDFDLLVVPGADHGASGSPYGERRRNDFFVHNLLGTVPRAQ